ncbi:hypothetical protein LshimejAT787_0801480 [Lyophyllum shimeji]|uniref:Uncharacterized protein n=1 Tax=Lyophyllum shimeji TaxID=47721 RepID=A0A9P3PRY0_LYOSH|nr:hypothetical protein LshimejAT787_0801480 [Lyophyllum shimeji]
MSNLKSRIGDRQASSKFEDGFIKNPSRRPSESGAHHPAPTTAPKSLLSRIGPVSPMCGTTARHERVPVANLPLGYSERFTPTPALPTSTLLCTPETKWGTAPTTPIDLTSNASVEKGIEQLVEASNFRSDNPPPNNGHSARHPTNGASEQGYHSKICDSRKSPISSTASTPQRQSSESEIALDMLRLTPATSIPSAPSEQPNQIQQAVQQSPDSGQMPFLREALLQAMMKNVQCRSSSGSAHEPETVRERLREVLSDEFCGSMVEKLRAIQKQMQALKSDEARSATEYDPVAAPTNSAGLEVSSQGGNFPPAQASTAEFMPPQSDHDVDAAAIPIPAVSTPLPEPPRAPRAMRLLEKQIRGLSMLSPPSSAVSDQMSSRSRSKDIHREDPDFRARRGLDGPVTGSSMGSGSFTATRQDNNLQPDGIPIPMDPSFFTTPPTSANVLEDEFPIPSTLPRSVSRPPHSPVCGRSTERSRIDVDYTARKTGSGHLSTCYRSTSATRHRSPSRPSRWSALDRRRTRSPSPLRRRPILRSLSPRRYRSRSPPPRSPSRGPYSPPAKRRRLSPLRSPSPGRRSVSRSRRSLSRRPLSPPFRRRTPVHLRTITREHRLPSPRRRTPPPRRRVSPPIRRPSPAGRGRSSTSPRFVQREPLRRRSPSPVQIRHRPPSPRITSARPRLSRSPTSNESTPIIHRRPSCLPLSRPPEDDHPGLIKLSSKLEPPPSLPPSPVRLQSTSTYHPDYLPTPPPILNYNKSQPPPAEIVMVKREPDVEDFSPPLRASPFPAPQVPPDPSFPCHSVPGLWLVKIGYDEADVLDCELEIDSETAMKWDLTGPSISGNAAAKLSLELRCLPKDLVQTVYETSPASTTAEDMAVALSEIKTEWPPQGSLIVQTNPSEGWGRTWLPTHLAPSSPALDLTDSIHEGRNIVRLIQLTAMPDKIFILQAMPVPVDEYDPTADHPSYWDIDAFDLPHEPIGCGSLPSVTIEVTPLPESSAHDAG